MRGAQKQLVLSGWPRGSRSRRRAQKPRSAASTSWSSHSPGRASRPDLRLRPSRERARDVLAALNHPRGRQPLHAHWRDRENESDSAVISETPAIAEVATARSRSTSPSSRKERKRTRDGEDAQGAGGSIDTCPRAASRYPFNRASMFAPPTHRSLRGSDAYTDLLRQTRVLRRGPEQREAWTRCCPKIEKRIRFRAEVLLAGPRASRIPEIIQARRDERRSSRRISANLSPSPAKRWRAWWFFVVTSHRSETERSSSRATSRPYCQTTHREAVWSARP